MKNPSDELNDRLRKAREDAATRINKTNKGKPPVNPSVVKFVPYKTMFKLEGRPRPAITFDSKARQLQCVSCEFILDWDFYFIEPEKFDEECPHCNVKARDFWNGRLHREIDDA